MSELKSDIKVRTYKFSLDTIRFICSIPESLISKIIANQLLRSSTSIGANIVEAKSASSRKEFAKYYAIALKSANESIYWLNLLKDSKIVKGNIFILLNECEQLAKIIASSLIKLKGKDNY